MSEWWTYSLSDFLMFSPRTYYRLIELYNRDVWPAHVVAPALGAALVWLLRRGDALAARAIGVILAAAWLWVAWAFHWQRYATINWAANYFAIGCAIEAAMLVWLVVVSGRVRFRAERAALGLLVFAIAVEPFIALLAGRTWHQVEVFGLLPDPTAVATLGVLLAIPQRSAWLLMPIPLLWCLIAGASAWAMDVPDALVLPAAAGFAVAVGLGRRRACAASARDLT